MGFQPMTFALTFALIYKLGYKSDMLKIQYIIWLAPRAAKIKRTLRSDWLPERARWAYLARSGLHARDCPLCSRNLGVIFWPYNKPFIDQACSVKMAGYRLHSFFCVFMDFDFVSVHKNAKKKELGQYPAILTSRLAKRICTIQYNAMQYNNSISQTHASSLNK